MSRFYMAAAYGRREEIAGYAKRLEDRGYSCMATWLKGVDEDKDATAHGDEELARMHAAQDLYDVQCSDVFILFTTPEGQEPSVRGGRHVEFGYALSRHTISGGPVIFIIGPPENIFHRLSRVRAIFPDFESFLEYEAEHDGSRS